MTLPDKVIPGENGSDPILNYSQLNNFELLPVHSLDISLASKKITRRGNIRYINYGFINFYSRANSNNYQLSINENSFSLDKELSPTDYITVYFNSTLKF